MLMFKEGIEEFYKCFMDKINQLIASSGRDVNVCIVHLIFLCLNGVESIQEILWISEENWDRRTGKGV